jgi:isopentenyl-diphosphate delta-isomerase
MSKVTPIGDRKSDHIRINLEEDVRSGLTNGLERYRFNHRVLPEIDLDEVDLSVTLFEKPLRAPLLISGMTGGTAEAGAINRTLAEAAEISGIAMGVGSQRAALEEPALEETFKVRAAAPKALLFANLGAIQLNYGYTIDHCRRAVDMIEADALVLHFNPLQEAVQPGGDTRWSGLLSRIEAVCRALEVPVIAKEVGWGFSEMDARLLAGAGVAAIDVAGAGGTSWSQVEMHRAKDQAQARLAAAFIDWGIPTAEAIRNVRVGAPALKIIASGGLRTGTDIAKCIALGSVLGGMASPYLKAAVDSLDALLAVIDGLCREIRVCMFAAGAANVAALQSTPLIAGDARR